MGVLIIRIVLFRPLFSETPIWSVGLGGLCGFFKALRLLGIISLSLLLQ